MYNEYFENRNGTVTNLLRLADSLGRSLRENVCLFSINSDKAQVTFLTESKKLISGEYDVNKHRVKLLNITIQESNILDDEKQIDLEVGEKITNFVRSLNEDKLSSAGSSFKDVLGLWETRSKFEHTKKRLYEKLQGFDENNNIIGSPEFSKLLDVNEVLVKFLKENKDKVLKVADISNGLQLSQTISKAFDLPKISYEDLEAKTSFVAKDNSNEPIYEMICKQELIKKELLESKKEFQSIWATNEVIQDLTSHVYAGNKAISESLYEAIKEVPYLAFVTKRDLTSLVEKTLSLNEAVQVPQKDIQKYVHKLFEMKKPLKKSLVTVLNEKYGINIQNLKEPPTFGSLVNTQVVIFETLSRLTPKNSILRDVTDNFSKFLRGKKGVESLDVNDFLQEIFSQAGLNKNVSEASMMQFMDMNKLKQEVASLQHLMTQLQNTQGGGMGGPEPQLAPGQDMPPPDQYSNEEGLEDVEMGQPEGVPADQVSMDNMPPQETPPEQTSDIGVEEPMADPMDPQEGAPVDPLAGPEQGIDQTKLLTGLQELEKLLQTMDLGSLLGDETGMESPEQAMQAQMGPDGEQSAYPEENPMGAEMGAEGGEEGFEPGGEEEGGEESGEAPPEEGGGEEEGGGFPPKKKDPKKGKKPKPDGGKPNFGG